MSTDVRHALLFGATGLVGHALLQQALAGDGFARITAVTRRPLAERHAKLVNVVTDFPAAVPPELAGAGVAFCCLGTTLKQAGGKAGFYAVDHDLVLRCAGWARAAGVGHFVVVSAMGASASSPVYYNRVKAETERDLQALGFRELTIMQPSLLLGERGGPARIGEALAIRLTPVFAPLMRGPLSPYTPIAGADVAAAMLARAQRGGGGPAVERLRWRDMMALVGKS